jgi:spermidine/putrescine transport system permease protein
MKQKLATPYLLFIYVLLYSPIAVLIAYSFNANRFSLLWHHFSWHWYAELWQNHELWLACFHSLILGFCASLIATSMSFWACSRLFLMQKPQQSLFTLLFLLIVLPDLVFGIALLVFFNRLGLPLGFFSLLIAHITFCLPFIIVTLYNHMKTLNINLYYSAVDLGASHLRALTHVILPLVWPSLLSVFLLGLTLSFDDVMISYFIAGPEFNILPLTLYSLVRAGITPELNALCSIIFCISMLLVILAQRLARGKL